MARIRSRRRDNLWRASSRHAWRGRKRWHGDKYEWNLTADLREGEAAKASRIIESAIEGGADLEALAVTVKMGATSMTLPVRIKKNGVLPDERAAGPTPEPITLDIALQRHHKAVALSAAPGRRRKGANGTMADAGSHYARALAIACWWIWTGPLQGFRLGTVLVRNLAADLLEQVLVDLRAAGRPASTVNHFSRHLRDLDSWLVRVGFRDKLLLVNSPHCRKDREEPRRQRLTPDDERRLLAAANPHLRAVITCAIHAGTRRAEILGLRWRDVDLRRRMIQIPAELAKSGKGREVPISTKLAATIEMRRTLPDGKEMGPDHYVFGDELGRRVLDVKTAFRRTANKVGLPNLRLHDLRRECGSRLLEAGMVLHQVRDWLGHADVATTNIYLASSSVDLRKALDQIEAKVASDGEAAAQSSAASTAALSSGTVN